MNFAAIADHYYLMERENAELKASKQRLMTALAGATTTVLQMEAEYDALKAVEAAARELATAVYTVLEHGWDVATTEHIERVALARLAVDNSTAALDAIRKGPDNGKTGEAVV